MEIYIKLFEVIFPVFFIIGIGYFIGKKDKKFDTKFITNFAANVGSPAMIVYALNVWGSGGAQIFVPDGGVERSNGPFWGNFVKKVFSTH